ncbi:MAG TPA: penicillin-binding protein 2 [Candidatus Faecimonas gallistercoris]|nr:penicillin-binding protein 2 [Candidatus Faecimonas gallistercoris]
MKKLNLNQQKKKVNYNQIISKRFLVFLVVLLLLFSILGIKLYFVMIANNSYYKDELKELSYTKVEGTSAPRGRIYDRNHNIIVDNKAIKSITYEKGKNTTNSEMIELAYLVSPHLELSYSSLTDRAKREFFLAKYGDLCNEKVTKKEREKVKTGELSTTDLEELKLERITTEELAQFTETDLKAAYLYYLMNRGYTYDEKVIKEEATDQEYAYIAEHNSELDGFNTKLDWERVYPYGDTFRSILGTVSTTTQGLPAEEKEEYLEAGYALNDRVGLSYIEKEYENYLKGEKAEYEVVNSHELKLLKEGKRGNDIVLSIDIKLQQEVERILTEQVLKAKTEPNTEYYDHSSVVIQDPNTGEILAMASKRVVGDKVVDNTTSILTSPVTPGSVVKGASMLVAYNTGAVHMGEYMVDECVKIAGAPEKCSSVNNLGTIDDITALAKSSNVYQFKAAIRVNGQEYYRGMKLNFNQKAFDIYRNMYHSFGLGVKTEIDLPVESLGYSAAQDTSSGNLLDFVMGQYETYTPIQLSQYVTTIANGGSRLVPHLLKEVHASTEDSSLGKTILTVNKKVLNKINTQPQYMARVKEGFYAVMHANGGYGRGYIDDKYDASGKTGTSQSFIDTNNDGVIDTETITSSFIGYAPSNNPVMSIMVTSPDSSHPNSNTDYASLVTLHITKAVTDKFFELYHS